MLNLKLVNSQSKHLNQISRIEPSLHYMTSSITSSILIIKSWDSVYDSMGRLDSMCSYILYFLQELEFWRITPTDISVCCWHKYDASRSTNKMYEELDKLFDEDVMKMKSPDMKSCWDRFRFYVFQTLENPSFSVGARVSGISDSIVPVIHNCRLKQSTRTPRLNQLLIYR